MASIGIGTMLSVKGIPFVVNAENENSFICSSPDLDDNISLLFRKQDVEIEDE